MHIPIPVWVIPHYLLRSVAIASHDYREWCRPIQKMSANQTEKGEISIDYQERESEFCSFPSMKSIRLNHTQIHIALTGSGWKIQIHTHTHISFQARNAQHKRNIILASLKLRKCMKNKNTTANISPIQFVILEFTAFVSKKKIIIIIIIITMRMNKKMYIYFNWCFR